MVAGMAHEVRNPLGSIALFIDGLSQEIRGQGDPDACLRLVGQIDDGTKIPMVSAIAVTGLGPIVAYWLLIRRAPG